MRARKNLIYLTVTIFSTLWLYPFISMPTMAQSRLKTPECLNINVDPAEMIASPKIPHDAYNFFARRCSDTNAPKPTKTDLERIKLRRAYAIFAWHSFLTINWPTQTDGTLSKRFSDPGKPRWTLWKERYEVFKPDGTEPSPWGAPRTLPVTTPSLPTDSPGIYEPKIRILFEVTQAGSELPLWDQNGKLVYYEILMNEAEFNAILNLQVYNVEGQIDYQNTVGNFEFPWSVMSQPGTGAIEIKLAWKIMDKNDIPSRLYTMSAYVLEPYQHKWSRQKMGLVGIHIIHKTGSSRKWIWSTFEHVDNLRVNGMEALKYAQMGETLKPSFYDPSCPLCPVNTRPHPDAKGIRKTQVTRVISIPKATEELNRQLQQFLQEQNSVWQYYELIGTQYTTVPNKKPTSPEEGLPMSITNRSGGEPEPVYLLNSVIETYLQTGNRLVEDLSKNSINNTQTMIFETQSCMGCHYSAGMAIAKEQNKVWRPEGTGDFSFMLAEARSMEKLFQIPYTEEVKKELDAGSFPQSLAEEFHKKGITISKSDTVEKVMIGTPPVSITLEIPIPNKWLLEIHQPSKQKFIARKEFDHIERKDSISVYILKK